MALGSGDKKSSLDPAVLATVLKDMDRDIATRFVASAFSLDSRKIKEAYNLALREMFLREEEERKKELETEKSLADADLQKANENLKASTKELLDSIQSLFRTKPAEEIEVEIEIDQDKDLDKDDDK